MIDTICKHKFCAVAIIAPIAKTYCDTYYTYHKSRVFSFYLFAISVTITIGSYFLGAQVTKVVPDLLRELIKNVVAHLFAVYTFGFVFHILLASSMFTIFRALARFTVYAAYTLGHFSTFYLSALALAAYVVYIALSRRTQLYESIVTSIATNLYHFAAILTFALFLVWFYNRYNTSSAQRTKVFDHELGAILVYLRQG